MENAHHFLCSPFSTIEQSQLLAHRACIGRVLGEVGGGGANCAGGGQNSSAMAVVLFKCRERCLAAAGEMSESAKFGCLVRAWLSEQNLCLSEQLRAKCGREAAAFYTKMQRKIFHKQFPLICEPQNNPESAATAQNVGDERKKSKKEPTAETKAAKSQSVTLASASAPFQPTIFVTSKKRVKTAARLSEIKLNWGAFIQFTSIIQQNDCISNNFFFNRSFTLPYLSVFNSFTSALSSYVFNSFISANSSFNSFISALSSYAFNSFISANSSFNSFISAPSSYAFNSFISDPSSYAFNSFISDPSSYAFNSFISDPSSYAFNSFISALSSSSFKRSFIPPHLSVFKRNICPCPLPVLHHFRSPAFSRFHIRSLCSFASRQRLFRKSNGHNDNLQHRDGTSRMFFFEVLPIDEMLHNA
uniref:Uncharacterized protein n=1 Tax=Globodera pallida TaxID=36090 RepID=A0A183CAT3_GLOPA